MKALRMLVLSAVCILLAAPVLLPAERDVTEPGGRAGTWSKRQAWRHDPSKVVVPKGYKVGLFKGGLDTVSAVTVDKDGNVWANISGSLFGGLDDIDQPHVKVFDKNGKLLKEIGKGVFKSVLHENYYCEENGKTYVTEYGRGLWEIDGVNGTPQIKLDTLPIGDHQSGGVTCRDGYIWYTQGAPSNQGFADPDNHGWTDIPDPYWAKHGEPGMPTTPRDPPCRDIVLTGLNVLSSDGRLTGAYLPVGVPSKPGQVIKAQAPCGGGIHRMKYKDGKYEHNEVEIWGMGLRYPAGITWGRKGSRFEKVLFITDNGMNDKGNRRVANGSEKLWAFTRKGQDAGFPDKEGANFVSNKRYGWATYNGGIVQRPHPNLYIGDKPWVPQLPPYRFIEHSMGVRGVPLIVANPNWDNYITPLLEWDTNNPMDGIAMAPDAFGTKDTLFTAVWGIVDNGPESLIPRWATIVRIELLDPIGVQWTQFAQNIDPGPNAYQKPENRGGLERVNDVFFSNDGKTMYIADYGEVVVNYQMESPFYTTKGTGAIWTITKE